MKPLEYNLKIFQIMAVFPVSDGTPSRIKYRNYCFGIFIFLAATLTAISSITSVVVYLKSDLEKTLYAMFQVAGLVYVSYSYAVAHVTWKRLRNIFSRLQKICDGSMWIFSSLLLVTVFKLHCGKNYLYFRQGSRWGWFLCESKQTQWTHFKAYYDWHSDRCRWTWSAAQFSLNRYFNVFFRWNSGEYTFSAVSAQVFFSIHFIPLLFS